MNLKLIQTIAIRPAWAIEEASARSYIDQLEAFGDTVLTRPESAYSDGEGESRPYDVQRGVAILSLSGPLTKADTCASWYFGGTSTATFRRKLRRAENDPQVKKILLVIDSPGGEVDGTSDLAEDVSRINAKKPVVAFASDLCASAAYWIGSQASEFYANSTATVGSIGTYMTIADRSEQAARSGIKVHVISTGPQKGAGVQGTAITEAHLAEFQTYVDALNAEFLAAVGKGRKMSAEQVKELATGQVWVGKKAAELGLVDKIDSLDNVLERMQASAPLLGLPSASSTPERTGNPKQENPMLEKILALFRSNPEIAEQAGITASEVAAATLPAVQTPSIPVEAPAAVVPDPTSANLRQQIIKIYADQFADQAIASGKAVPAQKDGIVSTFIALAKAGGTTVSDAGEVTIGASVQGFMATINAATENKFATQEIPDTKPDNDDKQAAEVERVLGMTATGRKAAELAKKSN